MRPLPACSEVTALARILTVAATGSTNADLLALGREGAADEGVWLRAERQTAGRGRQGRSWVSEAGNLYTSTLVRLRAADPPAATLALVAAVAVYDAVAALLPTGVTGRLKWPNDLLVDGKKLSGILLERSGDVVVIGVGVNVAHHPTLADVVATSLSANGVITDAAAVLDRLVATFGRWLSIWRAEGVAAVSDRWVRCAHPPGTALSVRLPDGAEVVGRFAGLDQGGALVLGLADGGSRIIHAGDVFPVGGGA